MALMNLQLLSPYHFNLFSNISSSSIRPSFSLNYSIKTIQNLRITSCSSGSSSSAQVVTKTEAEIPDRRRLIAQNVPWDCTGEDVKRLFEKHGSVLDVELSMYNKTRNRGLAFITMSSEEEAIAALKNLNSYDMDGRTINLDYARTASRKNPPPEPQLPTPRYNVYVGNLAWRVRSQDLRDLFKENGDVLTAEVVYQSKPRRPAGYGFVSFASKEEAEAAISTLDGKEFMGRTLRLGFGKSKAEEAESVTNDAMVSSGAAGIGDLSN